MTDDITQKLRVTMPDFKGIEISCPCRIRSSLMNEAADEIEKLTRERNEARAGIERMRAALKFYAHQYCEFGEDFEGCGKMPDDHCGGCLARAAQETKS